MGRQLLSVDVTIIGGGVVGCAVAAETARLGLSTVLLEKEGGLARGTTSRNSQVSHGGMYYPEGSNKARFCVRGRHLLKEFCVAHGVGYQECGKLIVALDQAETGELERLLKLGQANGVEDMRLVDAAEIAGLEPEITACAGLLSPRTGIVDAEGVARTYARIAADLGAQIMTSARVIGLDRTAGSWQIQVGPVDSSRPEGWTHDSRWVVNAAGLTADLVAAMAGVDVDARNWRLTLLKGNYFKVAPEHTDRLRHLVYPVPPADGSSLGIHVCLDLNGQMKLGPDIEIGTGPSLVKPGPGDGLDYSVDPNRLESFYVDAAKFLPWLRPEDLAPDMSGYRPKLIVQGFRDFVIQRETGSLEGLINLVGLDSPGLTSSPAIAEEVGKMIGRTK